MEKINLTINDFKKMELVSHNLSLVLQKDDKMYKILNPFYNDLEIEKEKILL